MKWILFCFLLLTGCAGQFGQRDIQPSEEGANSGLTLTIDGTAVDVRWEDNDAVSELIDCVRKAQMHLLSCIHQPTAALSKWAVCPGAFQQAMCG